MSKMTRNASSSKALEHPLPMPMPPLSDAYQDLRVSVDRFCLLAGIEAIGEMLAADAETVCGPRHARTAERRDHRWGTTTSELAFQGARVKIARPRVRALGGGELSLPSFELLSDPELLHAWAINLMVMNISTRKYGHTVAQAPAQNHHPTPPAPSREPQLRLPRAPAPARVDPTAFPGQPGHPPLHLRHHPQPEEVH